MTGSRCLTDFQASLSIPPPSLWFAWKSRAGLPRVLSVPFSNQRLSMGKRLSGWLLCFCLVDLGIWGAVSPLSSVPTRAYKEGGWPGSPPPIPKPWQPMCEPNGDT